MFCWLEKSPPVEENTIFWLNLLYFWIHFFRHTRKNSLNLFCRRGKWGLELNWAQNFWSLKITFWKSEKACGTRALKFRVLMILFFFRNQFFIFDLLYSYSHVSDDFCSRVYQSYNVIFIILRALPLLL